VIMPMHTRKSARRKKSMEDLQAQCASSATSIKPENAIALSANSTTLPSSSNSPAASPARRKEVGKGLSVESSNAKHHLKDNTNTFGNVSSRCSPSTPSEESLKYTKAGKIPSQNRKRCFILRHPIRFCTERTTYKVLTKRFFAGLLFGLIAALILVNNGPPSIVPAQLKTLMELSDVFQNSLSDYDLSMFLPSPSYVSNDLLSNITSYFPTALLQFKTIAQDETLEPAERILSQIQNSLLDSNDKNPIVLIPGIVSTGLEHFAGRDCSRPYFRKRMWGTMNMLWGLLIDKQCWLDHISLGPDGLDPPGIKLRAAMGLEAADFLIANYWVWSKIIDNLAYIGYDTNNLHFASYDWRLSYVNMEKRDHYFTKLKTWIELSRNITNRKVSVISHSMGSNVFFYFLKWVESKNGGYGGPRWVNDYLSTFVNVAGPMLGTTKSVSSLLSGEMRDTAQLGGVVSSVIERFFGRRQRRDLFWTWGGISTMLPKGGEMIWGSEDESPDDAEGDSPNSGSEFSLGSLVTVSMGSMENKLPFSKNYTASTFFELLEEYGVPEGLENNKKWYSHGIRYEKMIDSKNRPKPHLDESKYWSNPLEAPLPIVDRDSEFKIVCLYGVGKPTERTYLYTEDDVPDETFSQKPTFTPTGDPNTNNHKSDQEGQRKVLRRSISQDIRIDTSATQPESNLYFGVRESDGDGTVPLISLGYMCTHGWKHERYNPSKIPVLTKEYQHRPISAVNFRGGKETGDHVDILGNFEMIEDLLSLGTGWERTNENLNFTERILSRIMEIGKKIEKEKETFFS